MIDTPLGRVLDWRPPPPERRAGTMRFLVSDHAPSLRTDRPLRSHAWTRKAWLDQGDEGACTGFAAAHALSAGAYAQDVNYELARSFYLGAQRYDEWPGEGYEGSSVLGTMEYLHHETSRITAYWWAPTLNEALHAVAFYDPVEVGSYWRSGMMNVDSDGFIHYRGGIVGGHAYTISAVDLTRRRVRVDNSWGRGWGWNGSAWLSFDDLAAILSEDGECALPRRSRKVA